jgi:hypothetical protein
MGYKQDDFAGALVGLILSGFLATGIGGFLNSKFKFSTGNGPIEFMVGAVVLFIVVGAIVGIAIIGHRLVRWQKSWSRCMHGVAGGKARNLCAECVSEQNAIEASQRRKRELEERRRQLDADASRLQHSERLRLAKSLVPSIEELRLLSWQQFEDQVAGMFERMGYSVQQTPYERSRPRRDSQKEWRKISAGMQEICRGRGIGTT